MESDLGERESFDAIVGVYLDRLGPTIATLVGAAGESACDVVARLAHQLKSSSALFGAGRLAELFAELEQAGRTEDAHACRELATCLGPEAALVETVLTAQLARS